MKKSSLVFAIVLTGALALPLSAEVLKERFDKTLPLRANGVVSLENVNGAVTVNVWDRNEVRIEAEKRVDAKDPQAVMRELDIDVNATADRVAIKTEYPDSNNFFGWLFGSNTEAEVRYLLTIPRTARVKLETVNGSVEVNAAGGGTSVDTVNGSVELNDVTGDIEADAVNGSIRAAISPASPRGKVQLETVNGAIRISLPADARVTVDAETVNGSISSDLPMMTRTASRGEMRGQINGGGDLLHLETVNGSIRILKRP